jgi:hypothetical protein
MTLEEECITNLIQNRLIIVKILMSISFKNIIIITFLVNFNFNDHLFIDFFFFLCLMSIGNIRRI